MADTPQSEPKPVTGGRYIREADGSLTPREETPPAPPAKPRRRRKGADAPEEA